MSKEKSTWPGMETSPQPVMRKEKTHAAVLANGEYCYRRIPNNKELNIRFLLDRAGYYTEKEETLDIRTFGDCRISESLYSSLIHTVDEVKFDIVELPPKKQKLKCDNCGSENKYLVSEGIQIELFLKLLSLLLKKDVTTIIVLDNIVEYFQEEVFFTKFRAYGKRVVFWSFERDVEKFTQRYDRSLWDDFMQLIVIDKKHPEIFSVKPPKKTKEKPTKKIDKAEKNKRRLYVANLHPMVEVAFLRKLGECQNCTVEDVQIYPMKGEKYAGSIVFSKQEEADRMRILLHGLNIGCCILRVSRWGEQAPQVSETLELPPKYEEKVFLMYTFGKNPDEVTDASVEEQFLKFMEESL